MDFRPRGSGPMVTRQLMQLIPDHEYGNNCAFCANDPPAAYWRGKRALWREEMRDYNVTWDPTIRF